MKRILSSCDFRKTNSEQIIRKNLPKSIEECRLLFVPNEEATAETLQANNTYPVYALTDSDSMVIDKESL